METYKSLMKGGENGRGILPGKANESLLLQVLAKKKKPYMPPRKEPQPSAKQIEILRIWINEGATGPETDVSILSTLIVPKVAAAKGSTRPITAIDVSPDGMPAIGRHGEVEHAVGPSRDLLLGEQALVPGGRAVGGTVGAGGAIVRI